MKRIILSVNPPSILITNIKYQVKAMNIILLNFHQVQFQHLALDNLSQVLLTILCTRLIELLLALLPRTNVQRLVLHTLGQIYDQVDEKLKL